MDEEIFYESHVNKYMNIEKERNNMSEVPVSNKDLDEVIYKVTRDVIEEKAVNGLVSDVDEKLIQETTQDVIFVVERYMNYINELMSATSLNQASKIDLN